jgi:uncharacterized protein (TIGR02145 family)
MKKIILILCVLLTAFTAKAQVLNVCGTDSIMLSVENYVNGTIEWQESIDTLSWVTIPEVSGITYRFLPTETKYYRAVVKTTDCQPLYSAISLVQLIPIANAGTDRTIGNISMTLLGNAVPGATGEWTILSGNGGVLDNPANPRALLTGINKETYTLKWTLTNACGQNSDTVIITFDQIIAKNNFIVVDNTDSIYSDSTEMANGTYRIKFSDPTINPYDSVILIGMRQDISFLRRVVSFTMQDSIYTFSTVQGSFQDIFKSGALNLGDAINQALMADENQQKDIFLFPTRKTLKQIGNTKSVKLIYTTRSYLENSYPKVKSVETELSPNAFKLPITDRTLFKNDDGTLEYSIKDAYIGIDPKFVLDYQYTFPSKLTGIRVGSDNSEFSFYYKTQLTTQKALQFSKDITIPLMPPKPIILSVLGVPTLIVAKFELKASGNFNASMKLNYEEENNYILGLTALIEGEDIHNLKLTTGYNTSSTHKQNTSAVGEISTEFKIGPEISFEVDGIIGAYLHLPLKANMGLCANSNLNWNANANIGLVGTVGVTVDEPIFGTELFNFPYEFTSYELVKPFKMPYKLEYQTGNFQKGTAGNQLSKPILLRAVSSSGFGIPFVPVRFTLESGNGSVGQNVQYTDAFGNVSVNWTLGSNPQNKLKVSVLDCNDNDIENSPMYIYANSISQTYDCANNSLSIDIKTASGYMTPSVTGGTAPYTYSTNGVDYSSTVPKFNVSIAGNNTVYVKDKNQCIRTKAFIIQLVDACSSSNLSLDVLVQPNILTIAGKNGKTPYLFAVDNTSSFTTTSTYYKLSAGKHTVYIKDANGCVASTEITIDNTTTAAIRSSYPAQNATSVPINGITFQWTAATYATNQVYDLYLKKGTDAYSLIASGLSSTSYAYSTALVASTTYTWKVAVKTGSTVIDYSEFTFTTASGVATAPTVPVLLQPGNGGTAYSPATLKWTPQTGDFKYDLYLDANTASTLVALNLTTAECTVNNLVIGKTYYWKVKIKSTITGESATSNIWNFTGQQTFVDSRDGHVYKMVKIGTQTWMAENLAYLPAVNPGSSTSEISPNYYVFGYDGNSVNEAKIKPNYTTYGVLYNWEAAKTACPSGWHLPSDEEWKILEKNQGMSDSDANNDSGRSSGNVGGKLKEAGTIHWITNSGANNSSGFTALPGGIRYYFLGQGGGPWLSGLGTTSIFWSASEYDALYAWYRNVYHDSNLVYRAYYYKGGGLSIRCLKD